MDASPETVERLFAGLIRGIGTSPYKPRRDALRRLLRDGQGTLAGVVMEPHADGMRLFREHAAVRDQWANAGSVWDGRWQAIGPDQAARIAALGEAGVTHLSHQAAQGLHPHWRDTGLPRKALLAQPGLWYEHKLIAAPLAGWPNGWHLRARPLAALFGPVGESH